jgi:hypothetical protein
MYEERNQKDDRQRNADQPYQRASQELHTNLGAHDGAIAVARCYRVSLSRISVTL